MKIRDAILERFNKIRERIALGIHDGNWSAVGWNVALVLAVVMVAFALAVGALALVWKALGTLLGKVLAVPLVLFVLGLSYNLNLEDSQAAHRVKGESAMLDEWADGIYEYVRDAMFLAFRAVSEYTNIVTPSRASAIELVESPYTLEDGYAVFNFIAKVCGPVDVDSLKKDLARTVQQLHRAHELNGIPRDLTEINGAYYCPLQILGKPQDFGEYVQVFVVFATEKTVELTRAHRLLNLDNTRYARRKRGETLTDDDL